MVRGKFKICRELDSIITECSFEQVKTTLFVLFVALLSAGCGHKSKMLLGDAVRTHDLDNNETLNRVIAVATNSNDLIEYEDEGLTYTINGIDESKKTLFSGWRRRGTRTDNFTLSFNLRMGKRKDYGRSGTAKD